MTYRPAGSRSVDEILADSRATRERAAQAQEDARRVLERTAARRAGIDRPDGAAAAPAGARSELSTPIPAEGEAPPPVQDGQDEPPAPTAETPPAGDAAAPLEPGHEALSEPEALSHPAEQPEAAAPADNGPSDPDPETAPPVQSGQVPEPPEAADRSGEPSRTEPEPAGGASLAATPPAPRRTNAEKKQAVLALLQAEPGLPDREIARRADVSPQTVSNIRKAAAQAEPAA